MAAQYLDGPAEVTLRAPPPLGRPLRLEIVDQSSALFDGETLIAEAVPTSIDLDIPDPTSLEDAEQAASRFPWRDRHPYPTCFVCGPRREEDDGLAIFPGPVDGRDLYSAPWMPGSDLAGPGGEVGSEFVWGALDCPSGIVTDLFGEVGLILLGRLAVDVRRPVRAGSRYVVQAWPISRDGRKMNTASALFSDEGELCAIGRAVWIEVSAATTPPGSAAISS